MIDHTIEILTANYSDKKKKIKIHVIWMKIGFKNS